VFDQIKELLQDANGNLSGPKTVVAGLGAGVFESVLAVTPFESIKTTLYCHVAFVSVHHR
jgi:solute carrier family 25 citrate transporter 1